MLSFGGCNYLGLGHHPDVIAAVTRGLQNYGLSTTASRETTGDTVAHDALERELRLTGVPRQARQVSQAHEVVDPLGTLCLTCDPA